jgi:hypothetical protein
VGFNAGCGESPWLQHLQFLQAGDCVCAGRGGFDLTVNIKEFSVFPNVKRPAFRDCPAFMNYTVGLSDFLSRITEDGIVDTKRFSESFVVFWRICAGGKVGDVGVLERFAILTE